MVPSQATTRRPNVCDQNAGGLAAGSHNRSKSIWTGLAPSRCRARVSAELVAPYPPGVPVLAPGELITASALDALREVRDDGGRIAYAADPSLATFQVVVTG